jgi:hypothetical protein
MIRLHFIVRCTLQVFLLFVLPKIALSQQEFYFKYHLNTRKLRIVSRVEYGDPGNRVNIEKLEKKGVRFLVVDYWEDLSDHRPPAPPPAPPASAPQPAPGVPVPAPAPAPGPAPKSFKPVDSTAATPSAIWKIGEGFNAFEANHFCKGGADNLVGTIQQDPTTHRLNISLWYFSKGKNGQEDHPFNRVEGYDKTTLNEQVLSSYFTPEKKPYKIHFTEVQVAAINLFYRYYLNGIGPGGSFTNANAAVYWILGTTKFYPSGFLQPKSSFWGFGPFVGFSSAPSVSGEKASGGAVTDFNAGVSVFYSFWGFQLSAGYGLDFLASNNIAPYFGLGVGFKLITLTKAASGGGGQGASQ